MADAQTEYKVESGPTKQALVDALIGDGTRNEIFVGTTGGNYDLSVESIQRESAGGNTFNITGAWGDSDYNLFLAYPGPTGKLTL